MVSETRPTVNPIDYCRSGSDSPQEPVSGVLNSGFTETVPLQAHETGAAAIGSIHQPPTTQVNV